MSDVLPVVAGTIVEIAPGVRRVTAPNPGMMTGPGTNSYLAGAAIRGSCTRTSGCAPSPLRRFATVS